MSLFSRTRTLRKLVMIRLWHQITRLYDLEVNQIHIRVGSVSGLMRVELICLVFELANAIFTKKFLCLCHDD